MMNCVIVSLRGEGSGAYCLYHVQLLTLANESLVHLEEPPQRGCYTSLQVE